MGRPAVGWKTQVESGLGDMDLRTSLGQLELANPILVASGTFGYATESADFVEIRRLGAIVPKTVTQAPRPGNPPPRIVETAAGMLNAIGLDNDGIEHFLAHHLPNLVQLGTKVIVNVAGKSVEEFWELAARVEGAGQADALELNLSCPNVAGGVDFATNPQTTERVVAGVRQRTRLPILAKLTPNIADILPIVRAAEAGGADGVTLINTVVGAAVDWRRRKPILANVFGGMSGPALKPIALRFVLHVANATTMPIVAAGGIASIDDVMEFLVAGAAAVQIGTANFYDPGVPTKLLDQLPDALRTIGASTVREVIRSVQWPTPRRVP